MILSDLSSADIEGMSYNELIGVVGETNRIPGGTRTCSLIAREAMLGDHSLVLDVGCSTGSTTLDLTRMSRCRAIGVDINDLSIQTARQRASALGIERAMFQKEDATSLSFPDGQFDVVVCGNVTALVHDSSAALAEYSRVLVGNGLLVAVPMYYIKEPSPALVDEVSSTIQVSITPQYRQDWVEFYDVPGFEPWCSAHFAFDDIPESRVVAYCDEMLAQTHLDSLSSDAQQMLDRRYRAAMDCFRRNLALMGFTVLMLRKSSLSLDPELFTASPTP